MLWGRNSHLATTSHRYYSIGEFFELIVYFRGMKINRNSFLFFCCPILVFLVFCFTLRVQAQGSKDSLNYYYSKISNPENADNLLEAYSYFKTRQAIELKRGDTLKSIFSLRMLSISEIALGMYYDAENTSIKALKLLDKKTGKSDFYIENKKAFYNNLGIIYRSLDNHEASILNYKKSLSLAVTSIDSAKILNNLGITNRYKKDFKTSRLQFKNAHALFMATKDTVNTAIVLDNLGSVQGLLNEQEGIKNMLNALDIRLKHNDFSHMYTSYMHLTEFYKNHGNLAKAKYYADLGYQVAKKYSAEYTEDALFARLELTDNGLVKEYLKLNDSIRRAKLVNENKFADAKYNLEKEKEQTQIAQLQREKEKRQKLLYLTLAITVAALSVAIIAFILYRRKQKRLKDIQETEAQLSKKIHDELANDTFQVMVQLQNLAQIPQEIMDKLDDIYLKTRDISSAYSPLIEDVDFYDQLINRLNSYRSQQLNVITRNADKINWEALPAQKKVAIYMILRELMTNNKKHSKSTLALFVFEQIGKKIQIIYNDNGVGARLKKSHGLQNVEFRIHALKGTITFDSEINKGFKVNIQI